MEKRKYHGKDISLLGFGLMRLPKEKPGTFDIDYEASSKLIDYAMANGVNYYDTAYVYGGSEAFAGYALSKHPRESFYLATKCPAGMVKGPEDVERIFAEKLERCKTDYFDFYLVHNLSHSTYGASNNEEFFERFEKSAIYNTLKQKKAEGKIRNLGFSFHGTPGLLEPLAEKYEWDFAQIQLNYMDWEATDAKGQYEILTKNNNPVVIMEPLRGGTLAQLTDEAAKLLKEAKSEASVASWGIRYAASLPNVLTVLSGMNAMDQLEDNIGVMNGFQPITDQERAVLADAAAIYNRTGAIPCTGCRYCMPCPKGVDIPRVFSIYNHYRIVNFRIPFINSYGSLDEKEKASSCVACGKCAEKCPQHLTIPEYLKEINDFANEKPARA